MNHEQAHIRCLLLSSENECALLPAANVAEIVPFAPPRLIQGKPGWFLGGLTWRDQEVPVICLDALKNRAMEQRSGVSQKAKVAVLYGTHSTTQLPFYGIRVTKPPRPLVVAREDLTALNKNEPDLSLGLAMVKVGDTEATIPNLEALEDKIREVFC